MEQVNARDPQALRNLLYMREPLRKFVQKISWRKDEASWKTIKDEQGREQGHEIVGAAGLGEERWDLMSTLAGASSIDSEQMLAVAIESLVKLINFALKGEKIDAAGADLFLAKFDVSSHPVHPDRKKQLASLRILDLTCAMALLPGEWVLNRQVDTMNRPETHGPTNGAEALTADETGGMSGSFIILQLQRASQLAHCLSKLIIFDNMEAAEYVYASQLVLPLIRQLNGEAQVTKIEETKMDEGKNSKKGKTEHGELSLMELQHKDEVPVELPAEKSGTAAWDFRTMSQEAAASIEVVMQGNMIDNFSQEILAKNFGQINSKTEVKTTIAKYQFLANGLLQGASVKKQQRWILREVVKLSNQYFLPIPGITSEDEHGTYVQLHLPIIRQSAGIGEFGMFPGEFAEKSEAEKARLDQGKEGDPAWTEAIITDLEAPHLLREGSEEEIVNFVSWTRQDPDLTDGDASHIRHKLYYTYALLCSRLASGLNFWCQVCTCHTPKRFPPQL
jgi:hypothetical protein